MIELIFVIVILGILAAVAIPKLAATRDDAKVSAIVGNARTALGDMTAYYTSQGGTNFSQATLGTVTNVPFETTGCGGNAAGSTIAGGVFDLCETTNSCVTFTIDGNATSPASQITISTGGSGTAVCDAVANDPAILAMKAQPQKLGGTGVKR